MNQPRKLKLRVGQYRARRGVTIIEVLTSIVVAVIGVAGVLILIPFGIRQAETGLDLDDSTSLAENAMARFQIEGYGQLSLYGGEGVLPWVDGMDLVKLEYNPNDPAGYYFIDPLWLSAQGNPAQAVIDALFLGNGDPAIEALFVGGIPNSIPPFQPRFVHLLDLAAPFDPAGMTPQPINLALAARMFVSNDDLQFAVKKDPTTGLDLDDFAPPQPYFDVDVTNTALRRQFRGEISWSAVAIPKRKTGDVNLNSNDGAGQRTEGFDFYIVVYKDRSFEDPTNVVNPDRDPRFLYSVLEPANNAGADPRNVNPDRIFGTGTVVLANDVDIRRDEWVMLVNYDLNGQAQVGFFRVIGTHQRSITIDGSDFTITDSLSDGSPNRSPTFIIYLRNVINVFKRQLNFEAESGTGFGQ